MNKKVQRQQRQLHYIELMLRQIQTKHLIRAMSALKTCPAKGEQDPNYGNLSKSFLTQTERDMINKRMRLQHAPQSSTTREKQMQGKSILTDRQLNLYVCGASYVY